MPMMTSISSSPTRRRLRLKKRKRRLLQKPLKPLKLLKWKKQISRSQHLPPLMSKPRLRHPLLNPQRKSLPSR